jgi:hypothetical protein
MLPLFLKAMVLFGSNGKVILNVNLTNGFFANYYKADDTSGSETTEEE